MAGGACGVTEKISPPNRAPLTPNSSTAHFREGGLLFFESHLQILHEEMSIAPYPFLTDAYGVQTFLGFPYPPASTSVRPEGGAGGKPEGRRRGEVRACLPLALPRRMSLAVSVFALWSQRPPGSPAVTSVAPQEARP